MDLASNVQARLKRVSEAKVAHGLPKRSRLGVKANPQPTDYPNTALVAKAELKRLNSIANEAKKKKQRLENIAAAQAVTAVTNQPELAHGVSYGVGALVNDSEAPHITHDMRHVACATATVIFCNVCGKWSRRNAHSKLALACTGECTWRGGLNLLRHGIMPVQGARLPAAARGPTRGANN